MKYRYLDLELLSNEDREMLDKAGFVISSNNAIDENLYQSIALSNYVYIEINKMIQERMDNNNFKLTDEEKADIASEVSVVINAEFDFEAEVKKYLKTAIEAALNRIEHERTR